MVCRKIETPQRKPTLKYQAARDPELQIPSLSNHQAWHLEEVQGWITRSTHGSSKEAQANQNLESELQSPPNYESTRQKYHRIEKPQDQTIPLDTDERQDHSVAEQEHPKPIWKTCFQRRKGSPRVHQASHVRDCPLPRELKHRKVKNFGAQILVWADEDGLATDPGETEEATTCCPPKGNQKLCEHQAAVPELPPKRNWVPVLCY